MERSYEEKLALVMDLRPIDDVFFEVLAKNKAVCREILSTIMEDPDLIVEQVITQDSEQNIYGRSVRLDALCILGDGRKVNIEVQRSNHDDHFRRARFNASSITTHESQTGTNFKELPDLYIIYISEFDFIKEGRTIYHIDKVIRESGTTIDDGLHEIFVNTAIDDGSIIAELMSCFTKKSFDNPRFPEFSSEIKRLKETKGGRKAMSWACEAWHKDVEEAREEGIIIGEKRSAEKIKKAEEKAEQVNAKNEALQAEIEKLKALLEAKK